MWAVTAAGVSGVLLAGGQGWRMGGGDKCLRLLAGRTILDRIVERVRPQVARLLLNANGDPERFASTGLPVSADTLPGHLGPLAGVLTGMEWAAAQAPDSPWLLTVPTDAPFLPADLVARLLAAVEADGADMACAVSGGRTHPVVGLWPIRLASALRRAMLDEDMRKVGLWTGRYRLAAVAWETEPLDPFFNANRPDDLAIAERILSRCGASHNGHGV
ncbi:MAG: molybdenum cofactor guanylyltransferase MobA [Alphaproteobacteria bacterium]